MLIYIKNESKALGECRRQLNGSKKANVKKKQKKNAKNKWPNNGIPLSSIRDNSATAPLKCSCWVQQIAARKFLSFIEYSCVAIQWLFTQPLLQRYFDFLQLHFGFCRHSAFPLLLLRLHYYTYIPYDSLSHSLFMFAAIFVHINDIYFYFIYLWDSLAENILFDWFVRRAKAKDITRSWLLILCLYGMWYMV